MRKQYKTWISKRVPDTIQLATSTNHHGLSEKRAIAIRNISGSADIIRWYSGYKDLGEALVHRDSGLMALSYEGMPVPEKPKRYNSDDNIFVPAEGLRVISKAAESNVAKDK